MTAPALTGITVLELGQAFMGPYCGLLMQRLGADVIKVEPPQGEPYRRPTAAKASRPCSSVSSMRASEASAST